MKIASTITAVLLALPLMAAAKCQYNAVCCDIFVQSVGAGKAAVGCSKSIGPCLAVLDVEDDDSKVIACCKNL
ncbi:hypothetical protein GALMADRAFT_265872, partial [Galerina marginata CBS 339.88]